jgi:hypothetical protein
MITMRIHISRHPNDSELIALADGSLQPDGTNRAQSHVAACSACSTRVHAHRRIGLALAGEWRLVPEMAGASAGNRTTQLSSLRQVPRLLVPAGAIGIVLVAVLALRSLSPVTTGSTSGPAAGPIGTFHATGSMMAGRQAHGAALLPDGRVLLVGGTGGNGTQLLTTAEIYDPASGTFSQTGSMTTAAWGQTAAVLQDGRVLVTCGSVADAEIYDPATGVFSHVAGTPVTGPSHCTATRLADGRVLLAGGTNPATGATLASAELFDPATGTFSPTGSMTTPRFQHVAILLSDGRVLVAGGESGGVDNLSSAELYDPKTGTFSPTGAMTAERALLSAALLPNGRVLIVSDFEATLAGQMLTPGSVFTAELYDPATRTFAATGAMTGAIEPFRIASLQNGDVLVVGSSEAGVGGVKAGSQVFDPRTNTFTAAGPEVDQARSMPTVTTLADGRALVAGGLDGGSATLSTAEIYEP